MLRNVPRIIIADDHTLVAEACKKLLESEYEIVATVSDGRALVRALCGLSRNRRTLVLLYDLNGFTHNEVAQCLGVTATTSKARLYQAHRKLRESLTGADGRTH